MEKEIRKMELEASLKSLDTEEFIDIHFYRPIGYRWALFFKRLGISPNTVTVASIFLGVAAGLLFYFEDIKMTLCGIFLLIWANSYDSADGQLARLTGQNIRNRNVFLMVLAVIFGLSQFMPAFVYASTPEWGIWIWLLAAITGFFHSKQAAMADYYRNIHLFFLKGKAGSELDNSAQQEELFKSLSWKNDFIRKLFIFFYKDYTASQEQLTPQFQLFFNSIKEKYGDNIPQNF